MTNCRLIIKLIDALKKERRHVRYLELVIQEEVNHLTREERDEYNKLSKEFL